MLIEMMLDEELPKYAPTQAPIETKGMDGPRRRKYKKRMRENYIAPPREALPIEENESEICTEIWRSVIIQALYDISGKGGGTERKLIRADALAWFSGARGHNGKSDFEYVCEMADMLPEKVQAMVKIIRDKGEELIDGFSFRRRTVKI